MFVYLCFGRGQPGHGILDLGSGNYDRKEGMDLRCILEIGIIGFGDGLNVRR